MRKRRRWALSFRNVAPWKNQRLVWMKGMRSVRWFQSFGFFFFWFWGIWISIAQKIHMFVFFAAPSSNFCFISSSYSSFQKTERYRDCGRYKSVSAATVTVFGPENKNHSKIAVTAAKQTWKFSNLNRRKVCIHVPACDLPFLASCSFCLPFLCSFSFFRFAILLTNTDTYAQLHSSFNNNKLIITFRSIFVYSYIYLLNSKKKCAFISYLSSRYLLFKFKVILNWCS